VVGSGEFDAIVVGSGFGGSLVAHALLADRRRVLLIERGGWVERGPACWGPRGSLDLTEHCSFESPYRVLTGGGSRMIGAYSCVGGPSVFYGGVSLRLRERDFEPPPEFLADSAAGWPLRYRDLAPYYDRAELLLGVAGEERGDPTAPPRSGPYPHRLPPLSRTSLRIEAAAFDLGLSPFRLPLAIDYRRCRACTTCDTFACAVSAKNDLATRILPDLIARGLEVAPNTVVTEILLDRGRAAGVAAFDKQKGVEVRHRARAVVLAAGALGTPHLLLASGLERHNPAGPLVGRFLMRHANAIVFGVFPWLGREPREFHKQIAVHDFYFGVPGRRFPSGPLGSIQQLMTPPAALAVAGAPRAVAPVVPLVVPHVTGFIAIAEDQPRAENRVTLDRRRTDPFGLPELVVRHRYGERDLAARGLLVGQAKRILARAGAIAFYVHPIPTFSHALGTVRMGDDPRTAPVDRDGRFRGVPGLFITDASVFPTAAAVNPSLTIAANALRAGDAIRAEVR
jgi:choline dehydrogenase-like flavoprotein